MNKDFENTFELFDISVRRLSNGNKLRLIFESAENVETEKELIEFRGENVKAIISQAEVDDSKPITIESNFEVFSVTCRRLRNGDKLRLVLERMYEKDQEVNAVELRYDDCNVYLKKLEEELDFEGDDEQEELDLGMED